MLKIENQQHFDATVAFAKSCGMYEDAKDTNTTLSNRLNYLENFGRRKPDDEDRYRVRLMPDGAPYSFYFVIEERTPDDAYRRVFEGGLLFHGRHDGHGSGRGPTFAVTLGPTSGWQIHT